MKQRLRVAAVTGPGDNSFSFTVHWDCDDPECKAHEAHALDAFRKKLDELQSRLIHGGMHPQGINVRVGCSAEFEIIDEEAGI